MRGLGTAGYLSSINYSTVLLSSLTAQNLTSIQGYISSLVVDSLQLGSNTAYIYMGDVIATSLSTVYVATGSLTTPRISAQQLFVSSIAINCNAPFYALDINANFRVNSNSFFTGGVTSYLSNSGLFSNAATATFASNILQTQALAYLSNAGIFSNASNVFLTGGLTSFMSNSGLFSNAGTTTFASNVLYTGGLTSYMSNSGLFSNAATATFASNVLHTGGLTSYMSNSGLFSNAATATFASNVLLTGGTTSYLSNSGILSNTGLATFYSNVQITQTGASISPYLSMSNYTYGSFFLGIAGSSGAYAFNTVAGDVILCASNSGNTTERMFITNNACNNLVLSNGNVGVNCNAPSFPLDVFGAARSGIPISSLTGTAATFANSSYGIYYYITNSAFATINLVGGAPSPAAGWYVTLRNNTGSYLSCTITGAVSSTPASPVTIPPSNSVTIAYDSATSLYVLF